MVRSSLKTTLETKFKQPNSNNIIGPKVFFFPMHLNTTSLWKSIAKLNYSKQLPQRIQATNSNNLIGLKVFASQLKRYMPKYSNALHTCVYSYILYYNSCLYINTLGLTSLPWVKLVLGESLHLFGAGVGGLRGLEH